MPASFFETKSTVIGSALYISSGGVWWWLRSANNSNNFNDVNSDGNNNNNNNANNQEAVALGSCPVRQSNPLEDLFNERAKSVR